MVTVALSAAAQRLMNKAQWLPHEYGFTSEPVEGIKSTSGVQGRQEEVMELKSLSLHREG